ncbi:ABC transporter substrate-binding protein [Roseomonas sp. CCTCC AB2023176]|uniref:ABC transporter substrate-binding protein n=1 Tax=Roseomonas sp. CCTCC AB2023176 TaxID=3342640 RepID=UPI0035D67390
MANIITRRSLLAASAAAMAATAVGEAGAQIARTDAPAPRLPIESGATLRMLRPVRFVQPDEDTWRANCARFTQATGVQVSVDFVGWEDISQQTAVTANTGAGPDLIVGFNEAPHVYADKLVEVTDVAEYIGQRYGGWLALAQKYGKRHNTNNWIGLPFGSSGGPMVWRKSVLSEVGFQAPPEDLPGFLDLCKKLKAANKPSGFALGNAVGDGNAFANFIVWSHGGALVNEDGSVGINTPQTVEALNYLKELYPTFIDGTTAWNDVSNNRAYSAGQIALTQNGVSLYFSMKNDPATRAVADDTFHSLMPKGRADSAPNAGLTLNAMVFRHSRFPNAAKALLAFLLESEQYDPWLQANLGYWSQPLENYSASPVWNSDPKIAVFKDTMRSTFWNGYKGPISEASATATNEYIMVQMCASVASGQATPEAAAREAARRSERIFRRRT